jgi:Fe-S cluster biogenesis protein NfuA
MTNAEIYISLEFTPNPNTLKYSVSRQLIGAGAVYMTDKSDAEKKSALAFKLFDVPGVCAVMIGKDFITVTKTEDGDWDVVHKKSSSIIEQHLVSNEPVVDEATLKANPSDEGQNAIEVKIREILDNEIRPAVAMDGGDITFEKYEDGIVYLYLQGACSGCPGAAMTLKMGVEARLREEIPEIREVVAI